ncbi:small integral membrane protein 32-like [Dunckerocampus dactyliophorus]|uniref:small integral membrane protein 32-like n=1 Tax=Dunckerocampus dactyliophorus TaxID=161453 RepID=UPI002405F649|nr:small integral membrane protein 32-like [Dunckerocampus dactyliophorus]
MLRQVLLNSTHTPHLDLVLMAQSSTSAPSSVNVSHGSLVSVAALLRPTAGRGGAGGGGGGLRDGELHKPDLLTYIVMCLLLFLLVLLIVFFINCQLRNSFFASMPYDRSLREARTSYKNPKYENTHAGQDYINKCKQTMECNDKNSVLCCIQDS